MLIIPLNTGSQVPLYEQIYNYIKNEIRTGKLTVTQKLPSTRSLSVNLQISRNTVELAYSQLLSEGYIESRPKSGYYVADIGNLTLISKETGCKKIKIKEISKTVTYDFSPFLVDITQFPFATWRRLSNQCMNDMNQGLFLLGDSQGDVSLRQAIARYLHSSRGANVEEECIVIGAGTDYLLQLLSQILSKETVIAMENPVYQRAYQIIRGFGFTIRPITVGTDGIDIEQLQQSDADVVYVTPSHQYPLGAVMPIKKRLQLLTWAKAKDNRYIIEDDHDSEFRYKGKPIPCLQGVDQNDRVIYLGTFSRAIAPAIRMGYMVLPKPLYRIYQEHFSYYASTVSRIDQAIITEFIDGGYFERHLNKMRTHYKNKHDTMLRALRVFGDRIEITGEHAGLHVTARFDVPATEEELVTLAKDNGIGLYGLNRHYINQDKTEKPTILLGFANLSEKKIEEGVALLYQVISTNYKF